jgi:hypothetical protein
LKKPRKSPAREEIDSNSRSNTKGSASHLAKKKLIAPFDWKVQEESFKSS